MGEICWCHQFDTRCNSVHVNNYKAYFIILFSVASNAIQRIDNEFIMVYLPEIWFMNL